MRQNWLDLFHVGGILLIFHTCEEDRAHKRQQDLFQGEPGTSCCDSRDGDRGREGWKEEMGGAAWALQQSNPLSALWVQPLFERTVSVCFVLYHHVCLDPQSICTRLSVLIPPLWALVRVPHESVPQKSSWRVKAAKQPDCLQHESSLNAFTQLLAASLTCLGPGRTLTSACSPSGKFCLLISVLHFLMLLLNGNIFKRWFTLSWTSERLACARFWWVYSNISVWLPVSEIWLLLWKLEKNGS